MKYTELHLHTHYSNLDGLNTPAEYMDRAVELGMTHLAITDHGTPSGHREFQREAKRAGITPILGLEAYISETDRFDRRTNAKREDGTQTYNHIGLIALNENGLNNLYRMSSEAWRTGFYNKPRIDRELLEQYGEDIVVLSGCLNGLLCKPLEVGDYDKALGRAEWFAEKFPGRFFIEVQAHNPYEINMGLREISEQLSIPALVTSDCHFAVKEDLWVQEAMLIISTNPKPFAGIDLSKSQKMDYLDRFNYMYPDRKMTFQDIDLWLHNAREHMFALNKHFKHDDTLQLISNTSIVADMIGDYPYHEGLDLLPETAVEGKTDHELLTEKVWAGLREKGIADDPDVIAAAEHELEVIEGLGHSSYFLIEEDFVSYAKDQGIFVGPGRGSAVASIVNYALKVTGFNPLPYNLQFFRFLDPERPDWPDIDADFEVKRRAEVVDYVKRKYGNVAKIATFGYLKDNSAIRDAARVFRIPVGEVNKALKGVATLEDFKESSSTAEFRSKYPEVLDLAERLQGRIRTTGMHAGGLVVSSEPIENYVPMITAKDPHDEAADRVPVVAYDMNDIADIGMIKFDILGLKCLTVIKDTVQSIEKRFGKSIDPYDIPLDDPKVFEMLSQGYTKGVFQCEAGPYTKMLINMGGVQSFDDLVASNALVRPGAANSSIGRNYIKGKNTGEFEYIHACTKYFTEDTYGQILFQEQQMLLCTELAGMTMGEANKVRKAIGKKIKEDLVVWKPRFIEGAESKISSRRAEEVWDDLEKSAEYAFNKAHSVGYSMLSYWTAWFKVHYPLDFMMATLKNETDNDSKLDYLMEAKRLGLDIRLPHINHSAVETEIQGDSIRLGLNTIKYISSKVGVKIASAAPYASYSDFHAHTRVLRSGINSRAVEALNKVGAASFPDNPKRGDERSHFFEYLNIPAFDSAMLPPDVKAQLRDLDEFSETDTFVVCAMVRKIKVGQGWALVDIVDETGSAGVFTNQDTPIEKGVLYVMLISNNRIVKYISTSDIVDGVGGAFRKYLYAKSLSLKDGEYRCIAFKTRRTKSGSQMAYAVFTDGEKNLVPAMVFSNLLEKATMPCVAASIVRPTFGETKDGAIILRSI